MRIIALWKQLSSYSSACLRALAAQNVEVRLIHRLPTLDAPYDDAGLRSGFSGHHWAQAPDEGRVRDEIEAFAPHAMLVVSWDVGTYRRVAQAMKGRTLRLLCMDNPWLGTAKQWAGRLASPLVVRRAYDAVFLPGERQAAFARRLGFRDDQILWGFYACDYAAFARVAQQAGPDRRAFAFVGRLAPEKGVAVLANAYARYRQTLDEPWPLVVCGTGPLSAQLAALPGVDMRGFVQPSSLPQVFHETACLVLPSRFEPWGVVVHEATAAGMAVICSTACGASTRLVLDGYNGAVVAPGDAESLAAAMVHISALSPASLDTMSTRSTELARQFTPERWARYLISRVAALRQAMDLNSP